ncbi:Uncharacterised protein [Raoultella ornithinolytica]|nr:Uncharacterised protein [Raoultella ornithinolytica]
MHRRVTSLTARTARDTHFANNPPLITAPFAAAHALDSHNAFIVGGPFLPPYFTLSLKRQSKILLHRCFGSGDDFIQHIVGQFFVWCCWSYCGAG